MAASAEAATSSESPERRRPLRIAVYRFDAAGLPDNVVTLAEQAMVAELRKLQRSSVLSFDEIEAMLDLEAEKQLMGCDAGSCLAEIAEALGADALVTGSLVAVDTTVQVAWKRIEPASASVTQTYTNTLQSGGGEEVLAAVGPAVEVLFPDLPLRQGAERGVAPEVALRLNPPPVVPWITWTGVGVTGALAIATTAAGVVWWQNDVSLRQTYSAGKVSPVPAEQVVAQQASVQTANAAFWVIAGATGASAIVTGMLVPFTDWNHLGGAE